MITQNAYPPMPTSGEYRQSADECRRLAEQAEDEHERETLLGMPQQWDRLAEHKAKFEGQ
jgi:hypothetical protein